AAGAYADRDGVRAIVPGDLAASEAMHRIRSTDPDDVMPPADSNVRLTEEQKQLIATWIQQGATYEGHWSFEPPRARPELPIRTLIDRAVLKRLKDAGLQGSAKASRETLIRRLSLDLRGLPPSLEEIDRFLADTSPTAWASLVDRMLQSPECAERLALDWLDVARYADTNGYSIDDHRDMWAWRDWVIHAFKTNKRYNDFIVEQLAGDLLPGATPQQKMATGFLRNSMNTHEGGTIPAEYRVAYIADKIDTVATTFMGLTMKCAQCHDHKYDPISQKDYYRFFAFFNSATERGMGATNGNTEPTLKVESPLRTDEDVRKQIAGRLERVRFLRANLHTLEPERFAAWKEKILANAPPTIDRESRPGFVFPPDGKEPGWIWDRKSGLTDHLLIRRKIELAEKPQAAYVYFTCDNSADLYVNDRKLRHVDPWMEPALVDITAHLKPGTNLIGADARNAGGAAGFIAWVQLSYADGKTEYVLTGPDWSWKQPPRSDVVAALAADEGWQSPTFLGKHGVGPWKRLKVPEGNVRPDLSGESPRGRDRPPPPPE
ncbi:MAG: DUF1549 domain-containing protein, partial [Verrucomicrobiota bacterium]